MHRGEICIARFPFGDIAVTKLRPVLLLTEPIGFIPEILVAYISSVIPAQLLPSDLLLDPGKSEFQSTRLKTISALRLHKLAPSIDPASHAISVPSMPQPESSCRKS
jgi:mRNA interferase MazF